MKKLLKPLALLICVGAIVSCSKKDVPVPVDPVTVNPISDYTITPDPADGFTFKFNSLAKNFSTLEWRFGDDTLKTDTTPTHTYLATGTYLVDLKTISKTGDFSHKDVVINIIPDSVLKVTAVKTENLYQLKFNAAVKGNIKSILWTFNAVDPVTSVVTTTKSTLLSPLQSFTFGSFNNFSVSITTDKGSTATISRSVTTDGIATDITQTYVAFSSTNENKDNNNENSLKLVDNNIQTKFGFYSSFPVPEIVTLQFASPVAVNLYAIANGNDSESSRDPKEWYIDGSTDGTNWDVIDHQTLTVGFADYLTSIGQQDTRYNRYFYYPIANPKPYQYYRWRIVSTFSGAFQIDEFKLFK
ncbi:PKD domain-containing protein [Mucilaginibacter sp. UR6-11]|uniref:PKD domain-containing protein n=1 Tax=Mucilaginibacter sp. UR6-11 TaxID=1435644 RepID=UPI001E4BE55A|nr:PKD domain-containing protein [Mucilaginibacter sp. UR6-11]MCC8426658.1 PKD domain-containing protein [Mucilaginibacter sp. UR6-11]